VTVPDKYRKVQFFGYEICTAPAQLNIKADPLVVGRYWWDQAYHHNSDAVRDMTNRCYLMDQAVRKAADSPFCNHDADCLKVFVAPEFYFRGERGGYELNQISDVLVPALQGMVCAREFEHWLFVFGSMIGYAQFDKAMTTLRDGQPQPVVRRDPVPSETHEVYNAVLVQQGGTTGIEGSRIVMKEFKSGIDFLSRVKNIQGRQFRDRAPGNKLLHERVKHLTAGKRIGDTPRFDPNRGHGKERSRRADSGLGIFDHGGITFGVEVCLDHAMSRLRRSPPAVGEQKVRIQIVTSAGMRIKPGSVVAMRRGFAFNCDGAGYDSPSVLKQVRSEYRLGGDASLSKVSKLRHRQNPIALHGTTEAKALLRSCFPKHAKGARIVGYRPLNIPRAALVSAQEAKTSHWVADSSSDWCNLCRQRFSRSNRRHHCRVCGELICNTCSRQKRVTGFRNQVRVCRYCEPVAERDRPL
jgi:hypothetical protein